MLVPLISDNGISPKEVSGQEFSSSSSEPVSVLPVESGGSGRGWLWGWGGAGSLANIPQDRG